MLAVSPLGASPSAPPTVTRAALVERLGVLRLAFEFGDQMKQIATQPSAVAARHPGCARPIERLDDRFAGATGCKERM